MGNVITVVSGQLPGRPAPCYRRVHLKYSLCLGAGTGCQAWLTIVQSIAYLHILGQADQSLRHSASFGNMLTTKFK